MVVREASQTEVDRIFHALANSTRRDLLTRAIRREQSVSALASHYKMSFAAVQKHVAVLEGAALISKERRGREQIVHANPATVQKASDLLASFEELWIQRTTQIAEILGEEKGVPR